MTMGRFIVAGGYTAAGVAAIVGAGYGASHLIGKEMGYDDATSDYTDFMTVKVSIGEWWDAVTLKSMRS